MSQTLVSTKYQVVIPKEIRRKANIKPGQKLNVYLAKDQIILTPKKNWPEDYLNDKSLRKIWEGIDVKAYIDEERNSWE